MLYVDLMAWLGEINRPPGGKASVREIVQNCFLRPGSTVLDVGCNTGYCSFEIAHLAGCHVIGIDISRSMIQTANAIKKTDPRGLLVTFRVANAERLPYRDGTFDLVMSGGSTAFVDNKVRAIQEYARTVKLWGFVADINFFYHTKPPQQILKKLNDLMGTDIEPWGKSYWLDLYKATGLELYYTNYYRAHQVTGKTIQEYCRVMAGEKRLGKIEKGRLEMRLRKIMDLFNDNHRYLSFGVFILRKRPTPEQISLFGT